RPVKGGPVGSASRDRPPPPPTRGAARHPARGSPAPQGPTHAQAPPGGASPAGRELGLCPCRDHRGTTAAVPPHPGCRHASGRGEVPEAKRLNGHGREEYQHARPPGALDGRTPHTCTTPCNDSSLKKTT